MDFQIALENKTFLVVGTGISGIAACKLLAENGAHIILFDSNVNLLREDIEKKLNKSVITRDNNLNYNYLDNKKIENKQ